MRLLHALSGTITKFLCNGVIKMDQDSKGKQVTTCRTYSNGRLSYWQQKHPSLISSKPQTCDVSHNSATRPFTFSVSWSCPYFSPKTSIPLPKKWCELAHSFFLSKQATQGSGHNTKFAGGQEVFGQPSQTRGHTGTLDTHLHRGKTRLRTLPGCHWGD